MLELAKDYVPLVKRMPKTEPTHKESKADVEVVAKSIGKSRNYFKSNTTKNRCIKLLGSGNVEKGNEKYVAITDTTISAYMKMCEALSQRPWGFVLMDHLQGKTPKYTQKIFSKISLHGITSHKQLIFARKTLKCFNRLEHIRSKVTKHLPLDERLPLTEKFVKKYYWREKMTTEMLAYELGVPEGWVEKEIGRLGLRKKANGIKRRGKKGFVMPEEQKVKHQNQPHARAVVQICPRTFTVLRTFNSTGAVERDGWSRENVRKAIRNAGLHDGFLWAHVGEEQEMITRVKAKGDLEKKLKIWDNGHLKKETLQKLYIDENLNKNQIAEIVGCTPGAVACCASRFGLKKQVNIDTETLKRHYLDEGLEAKEIAEMYGYSPKSISTYLSKRGIRKFKKKQI